MNKIEIYADLIRCGFIKEQNTNKWHINMGTFELPCINAQYIDKHTSYNMRVRK